MIDSAEVTVWITAAFVVVLFIIFFLLRRKTSWKKFVHALMEIATSPR